MISKNTPLGECFLLLGFFNVREYAMLERAVKIRLHFLGELHDSGNGRVERIVTTDLHVFSWVDLGATLSDKNLSRVGCLTVCHFHAETLTVGISTQTRGTTGFLCAIG